MVRENTDVKDILYKKYEPILRRLSLEYYKLYQYYGYEYEDFLQEAQFAFEKALLSYDESKQSLFYTFVLLCVRNSLISFSKKISNRARNIPSFNLIEIGECSIADQRNTIEKLMNDYDADMMIKNVILDLPIKYSTILELKFNGFSYIEIATLLDIATSTIEYRIKKIRKEITKYYCKETI